MQSVIAQGNLQELDGVGEGIKYGTCMRGRAQRDGHFNFGSGSGFSRNFGIGIENSSGFFGIFDLEQQEFSLFGVVTPHLCFFWSFSMC
jgi:hypothetical protein